MQLHGEAAANAEIAHLQALVAAVHVALRHGLVLVVLRLPHAHALACTDTRMLSSLLCSKMLEAYQ